jgi:ATP-binding cassette, subfamily B, bacterial
MISPPSGLPFPPSLFGYLVYILLRSNTKVRNSLYLCLGLMAIAATALPLGSYQLKRLLDGVMTPSDDGSRTFYITASLFIVFRFIHHGSWRINDLVIRYYTPILKKDIRVLSMRHLLRQNVAFFEDRFAGTLGSKIFALAQSTHMISFIVVMNLFSLAINISSSCGVMTYTNIMVGSVFSLGIGAYIICLVLLSKRAVTHGRLVSSETTSLTGRAIDILQNAPSVRVFGIRGREARLFESLHTAEEDAEYRRSSFMTYFWRIQCLCQTVMEAAVIFMGAILVYRKIITPGDFLLLTSLALAVTQAIWHTSFSCIDLFHHSGVCKDALDSINLPLSIPEASAEDAIRARHTLSTTALSEGILLDRVNFSYPSGYKALTDISLSLPLGQKVGLVGYSGAGKSTFIQLISRAFEASSGSISLFGVNIKELSHEDLTGLIGLVPQEPGLFHRSLKENIAVGRPDATDEEILIASKRARCHDFITHLRDGYDTLVGERGVKLSGGQRQRIAIARAFLRGAPLLILDEATSALDSSTEQLVQESIHELMVGKTTLVIAHRLSTLYSMDRILVFDKGHIVEDGTIRELTNQNGLFSKLWHEQREGFIGLEKE